VLSAERGGKGGKGGPSLSLAFAKGGGGQLQQRYRVDYSLKKVRTEFIHMKKGKGGGGASHLEGPGGFIILGKGGLG